MRLVHRILIILATALLATTLAAEAWAKSSVPSTFFGTVLDPAIVSKASPASLDAQMGLMARSGVESLRVTFSWPEIEPAAGQFNFSQTDLLAEDAAKHGLTLLANLDYTPVWASSAPKSGYPFRYAPRSPQQFATFAAALVARYGPRGTFWKLHPNLAAHPVHQWQIWNEEGFDVFWATQPWAPTYTKLLKAGYSAIHHLDRRAVVVAGSLVATGRVSQWDQMKALYKAGARHYFDEISVHPFTDGTLSVATSINRAATIVQNVRAIMDRSGDKRKPIILTELTWPGAVGFVKRSRLLGLETTPHGEQLRLSAAYTYFATHMRQNHVTQVYWFDWASSYDANDPQSDVGYRFAGLTKFTGSAFVPQPALRTYAGVAAHYEGCHKNSSGRCG